MSPTQTAPQARFRSLLAKTALWLLLCSCVASSLVSCSSTSERGDWVNNELDAPSEKILWDVVAISLQREGFPVGSGLDPVTRTATSGWRNDLAPFRGMGYRERATVRLVPLESGQFETKVRVQRELNMDIARPLDLSYADWKETPDDEERARALMQRIRSLLVIGSN